MYLSTRLHQLLVSAIFIAITISSCNSIAIESNEKDVNLKTTYPWINENLFTRAIEQDYPKQSISIKNYALSLLPPPSINYKITLIRATVEFKVDGNDHETSFVIKTTEKKRDPTDEMKTIEQEIVNYQHIIPEVKKILQTIHEDEHIAPR